MNETRRGTGFILLNNTIVLAAHILYDTENATVLIDILNGKNKHVILVNKKQIKVHPNFKPNATDYPIPFDIAKITLNESLIFNEFVDRKDIADKNYSYNYGSDEVTAHGYGELENNKSRKLRCFDAKYTSANDNKEYYEEFCTKFGVTFEAEAFMGLASTGLNNTPYTSAGDCGGPVVSKTNNIVIGLIAFEGNSSLILPIYQHYDFLMGIGEYADEIKSDKENKEVIQTHNDEKSIEVVVSK